MEIKQLLLYGLIFGLMAADKVPGALSMISNPILSNLVLGFLLERYVGVPHAILFSIIIGVVYALFWLSHLPVGAYFPPNNNFGAAFALALVPVLPGSDMYFKLSFCIILGIPFALLASRVELFVRNFNVETKNIIQDKIEKGKFYFISLGIFWGWLVYVLWNAVLLIVLYLLFNTAIKIMYSILANSSIASLFVQYLVFFLVVYGLVKGYVLFTYRKLWHIFWVSVFIFMGLMYKVYTLAIMGAVSIVVFKLIFKRGKESA